MTSPRVAARSYLNSHRILSGIPPCIEVQFPETCNTLLFDKRVTSTLAIRNGIDEQVVTIRYPNTFVTFTHRTLRWVLLEGAFERTPSLGAWDFGSVLSLQPVDAKASPADIRREIEEGNLWEHALLFSMDRGFAIPYRSPSPLLNEVENLMSRGNCPMIARQFWRCLRIHRKHPSLISDLAPPGSGYSTSECFYDPALISALALVFGEAIRNVSPKLS